jgi:hypothetical protein
MGVATEINGIFFIETVRVTIFKKRFHKIMTRGSVPVTTSQAEAEPVFISSSDIKEVDSFAKDIAKDNNISRDEAAQALTRRGIRNEA